MNRVTLARQRRAKRVRKRIQASDLPRLSVHISLQHIYAQVLFPDGSKVIAAASTLDKNIISTLAKKSSNKNAAAVVGKFIAERAIAAGITKIGFDRAGYKYHGRVKALADAAREAGLVF